MRFLRLWMADLLGVRDEAATNGEWWEIDLLIVLFFGCVAAGAIAWFS